MLEVGDGQKIDVGDNHNRRKQRNVHRILDAEVQSDAEAQHIQPQAGDPNDSAEGHFNRDCRPGDDIDNINVVLAPNRKAD